MSDTTTTTSTNTSTSSTSNTTTSSSLPIVASAATDYPNRYYASFDITTGYITGWFDTWTMTSLDSVPKAVTMIIVSETDWNNTTTFRVSSGKMQKDGVIVDIPQTTNIVSQASLLLSDARTYVMNNYFLLGLSIPSEWVTYQKGLMAVVNGTSTTLPTEPSESSTSTTTSST